MLRVWSCNFFYSVICGTAVKAPPSGSLPVVNSVSRVARSDSGCSISPSTSHHIPQTCDSGVVRNRQGLSCRSASGSSGLAASSGCQLLRHHSLPVVFAQRSVLSNLLSALSDRSDRSDRGVHPPLCRSLLQHGVHPPLFRHLPSPARSVSSSGRSSILLAALQLSSCRPQSRSGSRCSSGSGSASGSGSGSFGSGSGSGSCSDSGSCSRCCSGSFSDLSS